MEERAPDRGRDARKREGHHVLQSNLNLCLFLQALNAISESEYVKLGPICFFFLVSTIRLLEIATFIHVPNLLCKFFCLQMLKQLFVLIYVKPLWLSGKALV